MRKFTEDQVKSELLRIKDLIGKYPSYEDVRTYGTISPATCQRIIGSNWNSVKRSIGWKPKWESFHPSVVSDVDSAWICGIIDGEGCFRIQNSSSKSGNGLSKSYSPIFLMSLRSDDKPMLEKFVSIIGCEKSIRIDNVLYKDGKGNPACKIQIRDSETLYYNLIPIVNKYGLSSKKKYEFAIFELAVNIIIQKRVSGRLNFGYNEQERNILENSRLALAELKVYNADRFEIYKKYGFENYYFTPR